MRNSEAGDAERTARAVKADPSPDFHRATGSGGELGACEWVRFGAGTCCLALFLVSSVAGQRQQSGRAAPDKSNRSAQPAPGKQGPAVSQKEFDSLVTQAAEASAAGKFDAAIALYRKGLALRPQWKEGWWFLATLLYESDVYAEAAPAFAQAALLQPNAGAAWAMLGLCEYRLGRYDDALDHIYHARKLGLLNNPELIRVMIYHEGLLLNLRGDFENAYQRFGSLAYEGMNNEDLILALGLSALRIPITPTQVTPDYRDRELIRRIGWAELQSAQKNRTDAQREYERVVADFPKAPGLQYAFGRFLLISRRDDEGSLVAFQHEIENAPDSAVARIQIAYLKLKSKEFAAGIPYAEEALKLSPRNAIGHYVLGRLLFDAGQNDRSITELEAARSLAPEAPNIHFALARAYTRANRKKDADLAREAFTRLNKQAQEVDNKGFMVFGDDPVNGQVP
jgi:tetratricopeptide (TPR) repeat protein